MCYRKDKNRFSKMDNEKKSITEFDKGYEKGTLDTKETIIDSLKWHLDNIQEVAAKESKRFPVLLTLVYVMVLAVVITSLLLFFTRCPMTGSAGCKCELGNVNYTNTIVENITLNITMMNVTNNFVTNITNFPSFNLTSNWSNTWPNFTANFTEVYVSRLQSCALICNQISLSMDCRRCLQILINNAKNGTL